MRRLGLLFILLMFCLSAQAQENSGIGSKFVLIHTEAKPYFDFGIQMVDDYYVIGSFGFYKGANDSYFRLGGGIQKFFHSSISSFRPFGGAVFVFEANPSTVGQGTMDSRVRLQGFLGGWILINNHIALDGKLALNLDFLSYPNTDEVEFGFVTPALGIVIIF